MNLYHYESKIQDYVEYQANKGCQYNDREETLFFLEGLSTNESQRFKTALTNIMYNLDKTPEAQPLPMDYRLGQIAQTVAELAQSDTDVGQDAVMILGTPNVRKMEDEAMIKYGENNGRDRNDGRTADKRYDCNRPGRGNPQCKPHRPKVEMQYTCCKLYGHEESHCDHLAKTMFVIDYAKKHGDKTEKVCEAFSKKNSKEMQAIIKHLKAHPNRPAFTLPPVPAPAPEYYDEDDEDDDDYFEDMLGTMLGSYVRTAEAQEPDHNKDLLRYVDPLTLQTVHLPPMPTILEPEAPAPAADVPIDDDPDRNNDTVPVICQVTMHGATTDTQADSGANCAITDNPSILHNRRRIPNPYPVGSIDAANKIYCTEIGELHLHTQEGFVEKFPCLYSVQSAGTIISLDNKCTTSSRISQWEQVGDTLTGVGLIRFRNRDDAIVATLPTYRNNGLWFTELKAIPAEVDHTARINTL
jgi:hypothetical protein